MKDLTDHLGILALGHLWNHPIQRLNDLLDGHVSNVSNGPEPELSSALSKLSVDEKRALKRAIAAIFAEDLAGFCGALDETARHQGFGGMRMDSRGFTQHLPPWDDRLSYFDREGEPKPEYVR